MIVMKSIKPQRMKDKAFRFGMLNAMRRAGTAVRKDFKKTTATWEHKVVFEQSVSLAGPGPVLMVWTEDQIYKWVNDGTRPHEIWAGIYTGKSDKRALAFPSQSTPKTQPRLLGSGPGGSGGELLFRPYVNHPGTEAREFDEIIQAMWETKFKRQMEQAMSEAARKSGHGG